jgi:RNA polymerase sigma-70 factor (ECF subfamily)
MDEQAFALLIEPHRRALHLHCYRMLGSVHDADDALQETMLRAWKASDRYEPRAQLSAWLHAIATNVCLTALARRRSRPAEAMADLEHLQPYPDRLLDDIVMRETVELAFITAIQLLPPKQRAILILRDVLGWSAKEVAEALDDSVGAVTSALQRARSALERRHGPVSAPAAEERSLVKRFMAAWDAVDVDRIVALLTEDAVMTMPPERMEIAGGPEIGAFFGSVPQDGRLDEIRLVPTATNRQPALAAYARGDDGKHHPYGLMVLQVDGQLISAIFGFPDPWLFELCGLPAELSQAAVAGPMTTAGQAGRTRSPRRPFP